MRALRWTVAIALAALAIPVGAVYGLSEWKIRRPYDAPLAPLQASAAGDPVAGEHMSKLLGCWDGCHGKRGEGGTESIEGIVRHTAPTLSQVLPPYGDAELARLIRYGVKRDGRSAVGMPTSTFWPLGDTDLANVIAHLRRQPEMPPVRRRLELTWRGRWALATGAWKVSAEQVDRTLPRWGEMPRRTPYERGRYLASVICSECHGVDFRGSPLEGAPSLAVIAAYAPDAFRTLILTNTAIGGRRIEPMAWTPDAGFTDDEIADLYAFLRASHHVDAPAGSGTLR